MDRQEKGGALPISMVTILIGGLEKALGPSYQKVIASTPWARYLSKPPSSDPRVVEVTLEEWAQVCAEIYRQVGKDLFISFGRYAGIESAKLFTSFAGKQIKLELGGLSGVERLQRTAAIHTAAMNTPQSSVMSVKNTSDGVLMQVKPCAMCSLLKSDEPICAYITEGTRYAYSTLSGLRVTAQEVECRAMSGLDHCTFKVTLS